MSGFSAEWLALREPVDHRSRNKGLRDLVARSNSASGSLRITDLGCGSGSNLRALAPHLATFQHWCLVDYDPVLLQAAAHALQMWADHAALRADGVLELTVASRHVTVSFEQADLNRSLEQVLDRPADLVTAAAFFDLVSEDWLQRFVAASIARRLPLYTVLTYDGREVWSPSHAADAQMLAAFHAHQASDKGFGLAAGPRASARLTALYENAGWGVTLADSPWVLDASDAALIASLADGSAAAVAETGLVDAAHVRDWRHARQNAQGCEIGHVDLFARPAS